MSKRRLKSRIKDVLVIFFRANQISRKNYKISKRGYKRNDTLLILLEKKMKNWWSIMTLLLKRKFIGGKDLDWSG